MLSRKYYQIIANEIKPIRFDTMNEQFKVRQLIDNLCLRFKEDNPLFNAEKFKEACGVVE